MIEPTEDQIDRAVGAMALECEVALCETHTPIKSMPWWNRMKVSLRAALNAPQPPVRASMTFGDISLGVNGSYISNAYVIDHNGTRHDFGVGSVKDFDAFVAKVLKGPTKPEILVTDQMIQVGEVAYFNRNNTSFRMSLERAYRAMRSREEKPRLQKWNECRHEFGVCGATSITCHLCGEAFHANVVNPNEKKFKVSWVHRRCISNVSK